MMLGQGRVLGEGSERRIVGAVAGETVRALRTPERKPWLVIRDRVLKIKTDQSCAPVLGILYLSYLIRLSVPSPQTV